METLDDYLMTRPATGERPLLGLTLLVVEDSRFASEAMRLLSQRSGARLRRADSLSSARRHLRVYRPGVVIIDMGLPDGSGADLIAELATASPRIDVILGTSGDPGAAEAALAAGADGFLAKPLAHMAHFQSAILAHLPRERQPKGPRALSQDFVKPDPVAYRDDLFQVVEVLNRADDRVTFAYLAQFLGGVARNAGDHPMSDAVASLVATRDAGQPIGHPIERLTALVNNRLSNNGMK
jgi:two-component system, OmpR family, response regulator